jgi:hypothetical protein
LRGLGLGGHLDNQQPGISNQPRSPFHKTYHLAHQNSCFDCGRRRSNGRFLSDRPGVVFRGSSGGNNSVLRPEGEGGRSGNSHAASNESILSASVGELPPIPQECCVLIRMASDWICGHLRWNHSGKSIRKSFTGNCRQTDSCDSGHDFSRFVRKRLLLGLEICVLALPAMWMCFPWFYGAMVTKAMPLLRFVAMGRKSRARPLNGVIGSAQVADAIFSSGRVGSSAGAWPPSRF